MRTISITTIVGARPQFIKAASISRAIGEFNARNANIRIRERIVHSGQHYDKNMSDVFFDELKIPHPALNLQIGSGPHGEQTGKMLCAIEKDLTQNRPDAVIVYGDTNSTLAGALAAAKLNIPIAHVEAGVRSFDRTMPEELNRTLSDKLANFLFCPTSSAVKNLQNEGIEQGVYLVGDVMFDSVLFNRELAEESSSVFTRLGLAKGEYYLATVHRAANTDDPLRLDSIISALGKLAFPVVFPLHPRTRSAIGDRLDNLNGPIQIIDPVPYLDMLALESHARVVLTDSGGVQKEAYWFGVPCVLFREETEWAELLDCGSTSLAGANPTNIMAAVNRFESCTSRPENFGLFGDGTSSSKIVSVLASMLT